MRVRFRDFESNCSETSFELRALGFEILSRIVPIRVRVRFRDFKSNCSDSSFELRALGFER